MIGLSCSIRNRSNSTNEFVNNKLSRREPSVEWEQVWAFKISINCSLQAHYCFAPYSCERESSFERTVPVAEEYLQSATSS
jgi:hypothetical protein